MIGEPSYVYDGVWTRNYRLHELVGKRKELFVRAWGYAGPSPRLLYAGTYEVRGVFRKMSGQPSEHGGILSERMKKVCLLSSLLRAILTSCPRA